MCQLIAAERSCSTSVFYLYLCQRVMYNWVMYSAKRSYGVYGVVVGNGPVSLTVPVRLANLGITCRFILNWHG